MKRFDQIIGAYYSPEVKELKKKAWNSIRMAIACGVAAAALFAILAGTVRDGGLVVGSGMTSLAAPHQLGELLFPDEFPDLKTGVDEIVLGTMGGQIPFGVRLIPSTENEMRAIRNNEQK